MYQLYLGVPSARSNNGILMPSTANRFLICSSKSHFSSAATTLLAHQTLNVRAYPPENCTSLKLEKAVLERT